MAKTPGLTVDELKEQLARILEARQLSGEELVKRAKDALDSAKVDPQFDQSVFPALFAGFLHKHTLDILIEAIPALIASNNSRLVDDLRREFGHNS